MMASPWAAGAPTPARSTPSGARKRGRGGTPRSATEHAADVDSRLAAHAAARRPGGSEEAVWTARVAALEREIGDCGERRWLWRRAEDARAQLADARVRLAALRSGAAYDSVRADAAAYARWRERNLPRMRAAAAESAAQPPSRGGGAARAPPRLAPYSAGAAAAAAVATRTLGDAPALFVRPIDTCDMCHVPMRTVANDSLLVCPQCHLTRVHTVFGGAHSAGMDCGDLTGSASGGGGAATANATTKTKLVDEMDSAQGKDVAEPSAEAVAIVAEQLVLDAATSLEAHGDLIEAERAARGPFRSYDDAMARLAAPLAARGVGLDACLRRLDAVAAKAAMLGAFKRTRSPAVHNAYSRATKVASALSGLHPPRMSMDQETRLRRLFSLVEPLYAAHKKSDKGGGLPCGYAGFLRAACILLGWDDFVELFPLGAASAKTAAERDAIHRDVFAQMDWQFTPLPLPLPQLAGPDGVALPQPRH